MWSRYRKDRMSPQRIKARRLWVIGVLALLPLAALASPSNAAAISGADALGSTHAAAVPAMTGPVRGLHILRRTMPRAIPGGSFLGSSSNWAGYTVTNLSQTTTASFNKVSATWTVPAVTCDPDNSGAGSGSDWVGLDGTGNGTVEQGGTTAECLGTTTPSYYAWWEMYPANQGQNVFAVNPGDVIHATVSYDPSTSLFDIVVNDETSNQTINQAIACQSNEPACDRSSAEVISEDDGPGGTDADGVFLLPDYGTATFTNATVTDVSGHTGLLNDAAWNNTQLNQVSSEGITKQTTGPLLNSKYGSSFSTTWEAYSGYVQLLANPGFETGTLSPWTCGSSGSVVTSPVHSGSYAAQITSTASQTGECDQSVQLSPNTSYTLSGFIQGNGAWFGVKGDATMSQLDSLNGWLQISMPFTTGSTGAVTVYVEGLSGGGNAYADDLSLVH